MLSIKAVLGGIVICVMTSVSSNAADQTADTPSWSENVTAEAQAHRYRLEFDGVLFSGPAWNRLVEEGRKAQFFLIGEEHGIAENPKLAAQLFGALADSGFSKLAIEISPPVATLLDTVLLEDGLAGLRKLFSEPGGEPAFFGMQEEAEMLAFIRAAAPGAGPVLWGADYEVASDRPLLRLLQEKTKPELAQQALDTLIAASRQSWAQYGETGSPQYIFSFAGDPELVRAVRQAWPDCDEETSWILETLEETLEINQLWVQGRGWESNRRRAQLLRLNFLRHWQAAGQRGETPRVIAKFGASHLIRGRNMTETFDLGTLLPELAALENSRAFSVMVVPGRNSPAAVLNPSTWTYDAAVPKDDYTREISALVDAAYADTFTLIDLAPLRPVAYSIRQEADEGLLNVIYGYDMLLVMSGSTASAELEHGELPSEPAID
jgi:hypothetical protein